MFPSKVSLRWCHQTDGLLRDKVPRLGPVPRAKMGLGDVYIARLAHEFAWNLVSEFHIPQGCNGSQGDKKKRMKMKKSKGKGNREAQNHNSPKYCIRFKSVICPLSPSCSLIFVASQLFSLNRTSMADLSWPRTLLLSLHLSS